MWPSVIGFLVLLIFLIYMIVIFAPTVTAILINGVLLWIIGTRGYYELKRQEKEKHYAFGLLFSCAFMLIYSFFHGFSPWHGIWWVTMLLLVMFVAAQNYYLYEEKKIGKKITAFLKRFK